MKYLFVCIENAGRSQMAEGFGKKYGLDCESAGTFPGDRINNTAVEAMKEKGVDISCNTPRIMTEEMVRKADLVIIMGCSVEEACPRPIAVEMKKKVVDWGIEDPKGKPLEKVREIRDIIENKVKELKQ
jgi:protein-tyrosine-phosphatase